jgi:hypothetical protein
MKWCLQLLKHRVGLLVLFFGFALLSPSLAYSWTLSEWVGVIEATGGAVTAVKSDLVDPSGDTCDNCGGTGRVGDGTVSVECAACDGTGKKKTPGQRDSAAVNKKESTGTPVEAFPAIGQTRNCTAFG